MLKHPSALIACLLGTAVSLPSFAGEETDSPYIDFPELEQNKQVWLQNCEGCHGWGVADAPIPMNADEWRHRVIKDKETLYDHAINGFFGPDDAMMPPKGGNDDLSDEEVKAAVDYMLELARYYQQK